MKYLFILLFVPLTMIKVNGASPKNLYDFKATTLTGEVFDFANLKGQKVLIVNTASKCGFTPQYADLEKLYKSYKDKGFIIIGFPANDFMHQEPGSNADIQTFCEINYGVTFPMMSKISVKGSEQHEIYRWLTNKSENGKLDSKVKWNFQKYMIDETGQLVDYASPKTNPFDKKIVDWIENK